jgi:hypothetical protein
VIANNRYKVKMWHHGLGVAKIETFYAGEGIPTVCIVSDLDDKARHLFEHNGWEVVKVKYDGPSTDFNNF